MTSLDPQEFRIACGFMSSTVCGEEPLDRGTLRKRVRRPSAISLYYLTDKAKYTSQLTDVFNKMAVEFCVGRGADVVAQVPAFLRSNGSNRGHSTSNSSPQLMLPGSLTPMWEISLHQHRPRWSFQE